MELPIWSILSAMLIVAVQAGMTDKGPQKFSDLPLKEAPQTEKKQLKREPKFETKEVILYLTPSQIRAYESGKGLMPPEQAAQLRAFEESQRFGQSQQTFQFGSLQAGQGLEQTQQKAQLDLSPVNEQLKEQMQNAINDAGQKMQKEVKEIESKQKQQIQLQENNKSTKDNEQLFSPEQSAPQTPKLDLQKREKFVDLQIPLQFIPQALPLHQPYGIPTGVPHFEQRFVAPPTSQIDQQLIPSIPISQPHVEHLPLYHGKHDLHPQNYAYLYFYPQKAVNTEKFQYFYPPIQDHKPKEFLIQREHHPILHTHPKFQLVPYEYAYENKLEAQQILQSQLDDHQLDAHNLESHKLEAHQLEDFDSQHLLIQKQLEPQFIQQYEKKQEEPKYEEKEVKLKIIPHTAALLSNPSKEIKIDLKKLDSFRRQEMKELYEAQKLKARVEAEEKEAKRLDEQLREEELKAERFKAEQSTEILYKNEELKQDFKNAEFSEDIFKNEQYKEDSFKNDESKENLFKNEEFQKNPFRNSDYKEIFVKNNEFEEGLFRNVDFSNEGLFKNGEIKEESVTNDQFKEGIFKIEQSNEAEIKGQQLKEEVLKGEHLKEQFRKEYQDLGYLQKLEPKRTQMYSILNPIIQGHSIVESLQKQKSYFPHHKISLETGFKPLQYAPKYNDNKHAREIEKILQRNRIEKQKALAKAAAIANEPPEIIRGEEFLKNPEVTIKQIEDPTPIEVKASQSYPVPLEIERPYPITFVKMEKVEVQKPTKNVYVKAEQPYYFKKVVPEVKREIVEIPIPVRNPLKLSIVKHVWGH